MASGNGLRPTVLWGATGQAVVVNEFAERIGLVILALVDNDPEVASPLEGVSLLRGAEGLRGWLAARTDGGPIHAIVAVGGEHGRARMELAASMQDMGLKTVDAIHPAAYVARDASWGPGLQAMAGSVIGARARLGQQCLINTSASVDHECLLGDGVHIGPGAHLAGCVEVGQYSFVGTGAVVLPRVRIGRDVVVGAGAVVNKDLPDGVLAVGNPARLIRRA